MRFVIPFATKVLLGLSDSTKLEVHVLGGSNYSSVTGDFVRKSLSPVLETPERREMHTVKSVARVGPGISWFVFGFDPFFEVH